MDIVIPFHPKDIDTVQKCVISCRVFVEKCRNIYLVCREDPRIPKTIWLAESAFTFSYDDIRAELASVPNGRVERTGWYLQQLLKIHIDDVLGDKLSDNFLVVDSDVIFRRPVSFIAEDGICLYAWGREFYTPYFTAMGRMLPGLGRVFADKSGICHHMVFNRGVLRELKERIVGGSGRPAWKAIIDAVDKSELSGFSEYETYFNYVLKYHPSAIRLRQLAWRDAAYESADDRNYDYVAYHAWMRRG
jgi:hypothetical protein